MVCLGNEQRSFCHFWDCTQVLHFRLKYCILDPSTAFDYGGYSISSKGFLPTVVIKWSSELNSAIPVHFSSLIPRISMFTLTISCLTTSNLPWFMDLTFQVPMQYCSLQHWTLLPSPVTSTTGCCFALALSLHSFWSYFTLLQEHIGHYRPGEFIFQCLIFQQK